MRTPKRLQALLDEGVIQRVLRPLMSGKEAAVYLVEAEDELRVAKVYKEAHRRSFKHRADYTEGRKHRNSRSERAMKKRSRFGREQIEEAWRNAEVETIYKLRAAKVLVPEPFAFVDGVLVMELVKGPDGDPAPRLVDADFTAEEAEALFHTLIREVVKMLCAGVVHGDLSDFNVLLGPSGPVIIDFPQAVDPAHNRNAKRLLIRDVRNLTSFLARYAPHLKKTHYGEEMWQRYERNELTPHTELSGDYERDTHKADTNSLLEEIAELERLAAKRREALGLPPARPARAPTAPAREIKPLDPDDPRGKGKRRRKKKKKRKGGRGGDDGSGRADARSSDTDRSGRKGRSGRRDGGHDRGGSAGGGRRGDRRRRGRSGGRGSGDDRGGRGRPPADRGSSDTRGGRGRGGGGSSGGSSGGDDLDDWLIVED